MSDDLKKAEQSDFLFYTGPDGKLNITVVYADETVWLTQDRMATLFNKAKSTINEHVQNVYEEDELQKSETMRKFGNTELSTTKPTYYYNLDVIISVGYRVKSLEGTKFRQWATKRLQEYIIKGFTLDDERLKQGGAASRYFTELLQRIRDIRSSERNLYQKVTDIYATSIDYRKDDKLTHQFFATVQNKMHYAVHGMTAPEIVAKRADAKKHLMGMTSFKGSYLTLEDSKIAKNYLSEEELNLLNLIVSMYLDFAEIQALKRKSMTMNDWIAKLDDYLRTGEHQILQNAGKVSRSQAMKKVKQQYEKYRAAEMKAFESDFDKEVKKHLKKGKQ
jgi:hypothetical protein